MTRNHIWILTTVVLAMMQPATHGQTPKGTGGEAHVKVVLRITKGGTAEVLAATEMPGKAVYTQVPAGNYLYEITDGVRSLAVEALPDPFLERGFEGPIETPRRGHRFKQSDTATLVVSIPGSLASPAMNRVSIRLHRRETEDHIEAADQGVLETLKLHGKVSTRLNTLIGPDILRKGHKPDAVAEALQLSAQPMTDPVALTAVPAMP